MEQVNKNRVFLSLGSNIDPVENILNAIRLLSEFGNITAISTLWETKPLRKPYQPDYINCACILETHLNAVQVQEEIIRPIESKLGRVRTVDKYSARTIDIDIMLFNHDILRLGHRKIPNAEIFERAFVALPLAEMDPDFIHPETGQTLKQIADRFEIDPDEMVARNDLNQLIGLEKWKTSITRN